METPKVLNYLQRVNGSGHIVEHIGFHESGDYILRGLFSLGEGYRQHKYETEKQYQVIDKSIVDAIEKQSCPQNYQNKFGIIDYWQLRGGVPCCSFCGSIKPSFMFEMIDKHTMKIVGSTTKSYKRYVTIPDVGMYKLYTQHLMPAFVEKYNSYVDEYNKTKTNEQTSN